MTASAPVKQIASLMLDARFSGHEAREMFHKELLREALERKRGNICQTARLLKCHRNTLTRQLAALGMSGEPQHIRETHPRQRAGSVRSHNLSREAV